jgi:hypothetical protein
MSIRPPVGRQKAQETRRESAEAVAVEALSFIAAEPERLSRFLALSGLEVVNLRQVAAQEGFLAGVMAFVASDEALLLEFAAASGRAPDHIAAACQALNPAFD